MTGKLELTDDMVEAIAVVAKKFNCLPQSVLKRMVFSYATRFADGPPKKIDTTNLASIRMDE